MRNVRIFFEHKEEILRSTNSLGNITKIEFKEPISPGDACLVILYEEKEKKELRCTTEFPWEKLSCKVNETYEECFRRYCEESGGEVYYENKYF